MLNALKEAAHVQPLLLKEQLDIVRHKHRVARYLKFKNTNVYNSSLLLLLLFRTLKLIPFCFNSRYCEELLTHCETLTAK